MGSGWFDNTEPSLTTASQGGTKSRRQRNRSSSNFLKLLQCRARKICRGVSHGFMVVRLYRTFSNDVFAGGNRVPVH